MTIRKEPFKNLYSDIIGYVCIQACSEFRFLQWNLIHQTLTHMNTLDTN